MTHLKLLISTAILVGLAGCPTVKHTDDPLTLRTDLVLTTHVTWISDVCNARLISI